MGVSISGRNTDSRNYSNNNNERIQSLLVPSLEILLLSLFFFPPHSFFVFADADGSSSIATNPPPPPIGIANSTATDAPPPRSESSPVRPGIAVVVAVLTCLFSITFLLVLYARHCKVAGGAGGSGTATGTTSAATSGTGRKNSGIDRAVVESLPVFRFGSLSGRHKEGLECAVCLNRFEGSEVLRLLPKCKHAFHVECVDTWLDGHSTCPLCRYRVDPEDVLLVLDPHPPSPSVRPAQDDDVETGRFHRVSGRHSSAGERPPRALSSTSFSLRRSLDGIGWKRRKSASAGGEPAAATSGCFDRYRRKDGMLLTREEDEEEEQEEEKVETPKDSNNNNNNDNKYNINNISNSNEIVVEVESGEDEDDDVVPASLSRSVGEADDDVERRTRLEHRINVVVPGGAQERWSDVQPSDLLYLRSEMLMMMSSRRTSASSSGRNVINGRSVSEITGLSRFHPSSGRDVRGGGGSSSSSGLRTVNNHNVNGEGRHRERQAGLVSRWLGWVSSSHPVPAVRSAGTTDHPSTCPSTSSIPPAPTTPTTAV